MSKLITHRCKESLKHGASIRYTTRCGWEDEKAWRLFKAEADFEYDVTHFKHIIKIHFCPYCGELLSRYIIPSAVDEECYKIDLDNYSKEMIWL